MHTYPRKRTLTRPIVQSMSEAVRQQWVSASSEQKKNNIPTSIHGSTQHCAIHDKNRIYRGAVPVKGAIVQGDSRIEQTHAAVGVQCIAEAPRLLRNLGEIK